ncbi:hypothetical protein FKP32DRAFT_1597747 [Trametes sanguinea]|nr:hypothetical protein FKP32DRAFT_1597747 [Trametes sanguinea]
MSPKRKGGAAPKPPAQPSKPAPTTSKPSPPSASKPTVTFAPAPQSAPARPSQPSATTSSTQRVSPQPQPGPSRPSVTINPNPVAAPPRAPAQPPKSTAQPAKSAFASHPRSAPTPAARPAVPQSRTFTRSDRVRAEWREFQEKWVAVYQRQIEKELEELFRTAERTSRKGTTPSGMDKIVNTMQRDFALAARAEWDARLERAHLQAEDWTDMTLQEMIEVEQVLSYEESDEEPGAFAQAQARAAAQPQPAASQKPSAAQPLHSTQPVASRYSPPAAAPEQLKKQASGRGSQAGPATEDARSQHKMASVPSTSSTTARAAPTTTKPMQPAAPVPAASTEFLTYAVPVSLAIPPLDASLLGNTEYMDLVYKLHYNSIKQFHSTAITADTELAMQLCKPMPAADREFTIRAHLMAMEQSAREIVKRRDQLLEEERKKRGLGGGGSGGDSAPPPPATVPPRSQAPAQVPTQAETRAPQQPPGAFPEERAQPGTRWTEPPLDPEPILEYVPNGGAGQEPETEPEVEEVIEIPIKGKGKKKGKKAAVVETKPPVVPNGRSTPTQLSSAGRAASSALTSEGKGKGKAAAPAVTAVDAVKSATARAPSPAPINTNVASSASTNGRNSPSASAAFSSSWGMSDAGATRAEKMALQEEARARAAEAEAEAKARAAEMSSGRNGFWAPPMGRASSNTKNPFAPSRPSRLAQVTQAHDRDPVPQSPESPEPPSPPPHEPTGRDYVAWFAGSSSEDEEGGSGNPLDEDDDDEDEEEEAPAGFGGLLASLAGGSPWALFGGESSQPQRGRTASPARGRGATPTPARFTPAPQTEPAYARWGMPSTAGPSGLAAGPSAGPSGPPGMWKGEGDDLEQMLEIASSALDTAATGRGRHGVDMEQAMAMYVTAAKARETLATPVGGRSAWRR